MNRKSNLQGYLAILSLLILFSCAEEIPEYEPDLNAIEGIEDEESMRRYYGIKGAINVISPSGDESGEADAEAIQQAIDEIKAGGAIVLKKGDFYLNKTIYSLGFDGKIIGLGSNRTRIIGVGSESSPFEGTALFDFDQPEDEVVIMNLAMNLEEGIWAIGPDQFFFGNMQDFIVVRLNSEGADSNFKHLNLIGTSAVAGVEGFLIDQPVTAIRIAGDISNLPQVTSSGKHKITNSKIQRAGFWAHLIEGLNDADIKVENNEYSAFKQTNYRYLANSKLKIKGNVMNGYEWGSVVVTQEFQPIEGGPNKVEIKDNNVATRGYMPIEIGFVPEGAANFDLNISKNKVTNLGPGPGGFGNFAVIGLFGGSSNAKVKENKINGEASFGIFANFETNDSEFLCNDLASFNPYDADYLIRGDNNFLSAADVSSVWDEGTNTTIEQNDDCGKKGKGKKGKGKKGKKG